MNFKLFLRGITSFNKAECFQLAAMKTFCTHVLHLYSIFSSQISRNYAPPEIWGAHVVMYVKKTAGFCRANGVWGSWCYPTQFYLVKGTVFLNYTEIVSVFFIGIRYKPCFFILLFYHYYSTTYFFCGVILF